MRVSTILEPIKPVEPVTRITSLIHYSPLFPHDYPPVPLLRASGEYSDGEKNTGLFIEKMKFLIHFRFIAESAMLTQVLLSTIHGKKPSSISSAGRERRSKTANCGKSKRYIQKVCGFHPCRRSQSAGSVPFFSPYR
ncbi:hypothetical protein EST62_00115 [Chlorobaculum sp. 24CR]|nr:hypothetical protein EST62_00115 [Chlorobaculum sp. 24CR]